MSKAVLKLQGETYELPIEEGTEGEIGIDITNLRGQSQAITLDPGYGNTGSCKSSITFINGEEGVLRYRGYRIEELAENVSFEEVIYMLVWGELPNRQQLDEFQAKMAEEAKLPAGVVEIIDALPEDTHPMSILQTAVSALGQFYDDKDGEIATIRLLAQMKALAAYTHRRVTGQDYVEPDPQLSYAGDFAQMAFRDGPGYDVPEVVENALNKMLLLHADHEQNCSASTSRMIGSAGADLYASISGAVGALSGPLHGGANQAVVEMLESIANDPEHSAEEYIAKAKDKSDDFRLMGFGHRVYKNFDPRAKILKKSAADLLDELGSDEPLLQLAKQLEQEALNDDYFTDRRLYPNVDFYSGTIYTALGIPKKMFTVMFALGRLPGWVAQRKEMKEDPQFRIHRPRQVYVGETERSVPPIDSR